MERALIGVYAWAALTVTFAHWGFVGSVNEGMVVAQSLLAGILWPFSGIMLAFQVLL